MKVLIVKTSSMGDVIHTLPAVEDALRNHPDISFDWCVEEAFAGIVAFVLWKMVLPTPKAPPRGETVAGARGYIGLWFGGGGR